MDTWDDIMKHEKKEHESWKGNWMEVNILHSSAGMDQQIWVANENGAVLVDVGDGTTRDIHSNGLDINRLEGIILTHGHYDHVGGMHSFLGYLRCKGKKGMLPIYAPKGCMEASSIINNFMQCYPDSIPFEISYRELQERQVFEISEMTFEAYPVVHHGSISGRGILDRIPAMGYRISYKGEVVAISGDTGICPSLEMLVKGADLAVLEAVFENSSQVSEEALQKIHLAEDVAKEIGKLAKSYILVHKEPKN